MAKTKHRIALIDGHSLVHRAFFALPPLSNTRGQPTNAIFGFLTMLYRLLDEEQPTHLAVAFDKSGPTFRHEEFKEYKGHRPSMPDELRSQIPLLRQVLEAMNVPIVEADGVEADDVIGTLAERAGGSGYEVLVVTGDRDALQLAGAGVRIVLTRRGISETETLDGAAIEERYGVSPAQLVDVKALCGDVSDNIPGVPTVGEKTALKLVQQYGSIDGLLAKLDEVGPPRVAKALAEHREMLPRNKRLATIVRDVALKVEPDDCGRQEPDAAELRRLYEDLEFRSLLKRLAQADGEEPDAAEPAPQVEVQPAPDPRKLLEASGIAVHGDYLVTEDAVYERGETGPLDEGPPKLGYGLKPWVRRLLKEGRRWRPVAGDALVAAYLLDAGRSSYPLEDLAGQYLNLRPTDGATAARAAYNLCAPLAAELDARGLTELYRGVELPLIEVLAAMEAQGVLVDRKALEELREDFAREVKAAEQGVYEAAGGERFNVNSTQQLGHILFEQLQLTPPKKTKTGYSTDAEVLEQLALEHPLPQKVLEYRTLQKLQSTYVEAFGGLIEDDGRIHTTFSQTTAATGRLASSNPNLQNIPVRDEVGRRIRRIFVAPKGCVLVAADYSQIELRLLAHMAGDEDLVSAFKAGVDFHRQTAANLFGVPLDEVTDEQRATAKTCNFAVIYGVSDFGLARQLRTSQQEAHGIIERYFQRYPGVKRYLDGSVASARQHGFSRTLFGRLRYLPDITSRNFARRSFAERMAMNSPLQGTAADLIKQAMVRAYRELEKQKLKAKLILQVHDELIFEAPESEREAVAALARGCMEGVGGALAVPLLVEVEAGSNWCDLEPVQGD